MTYDCATCGACCTFPVDYPDDLVVPRQQVCVDGELVRFGKRCEALDGTVGEKVSCRVYEKRPVFCRVFTAGSDICKVARWLSKLPIV